MEFATTQRGAQLLIYEDYAYIINHKAADGRILFWRCQKSQQCNGGLTTLDDEVISIRSTHNHTANPAEIWALKIKGNLKKKAQQTLQPLPALYTQEVATIVNQPNSDEVAAALPTFQSIRASLYRSRRKRLPPLPQQRSDISIQGEWANTLDSRRFLLCEDSQQDKIIIFATDQNTELLAESDTLYIDETFRSCPSLFYQLFTVHAFRNRQQYPLAYCLLPDKTRQSYQRAFDLLAVEASQLHLSLSPSHILCDFELAVIQAAQLSSPGAEIHGCYYHFCQCINRQVQQLGLQVTNACI